MNRISVFLISFCFTLSITSIVSAQQQVVISSTHLKTNDTLYVYTPSSYTMGKSYPTLFLLHGFSGGYKDWSLHTDVQQMADDYGFIIICPDGFGNGWYVNSSNPKGPQWRSFFTYELYPQMQSTYMINPQTCFITGLSMGGHGAANIFIDHPDWFRAAGSMSGVMDLRDTPLREKYVSELLGEYSPSNGRFYTESAINRLDLLKDVNKLLLINCGYDDFYATSSRKFAERCKELAIPYMFTLSPGDHTWQFWTWAVKKQLDVFSQLVKDENLGY